MSAAHGSVWQGLVSAAHGSVWHGPLASWSGSMWHAPPVGSSLVDRGETRRQRGHIGGRTHALKRGRELHERRGVEALREPLEELRGVREIVPGARHEHAHLPCPWQVPSQRARASDEKREADCAAGRLR